LKINGNKFVTDESYREEMRKDESFKEHLKKFDEEEKVEVYDYEYINGKLNIKYKGVLTRKCNNDNVDIKNSITTAAEEIPVVVNDNELKVTESKVKKKKKKKEKAKRKTVDDDIIVIPDGEVPPPFMVINGKNYRLRKKAEVNYESEDKNEGEGEDNNEDEGSDDGEADDETDEVNKRKKYKKKKGEDRKYTVFDNRDPTTKKGQTSFYVRRGRDEKSMRVLKYFGKEYDKDKYFNHGKYYKSLNKYLREKPEGSGINRRQMYEAEKKRRNDVSSIAKEEIRKSGRSKKRQ
jgi:hypothetical protein